MTGTHLLPHKICICHFNHFFTFPKTILQNLSYPHPHSRKKTLQNPFETRKFSQKIENQNSNSNSPPQTPLCQGKSPTSRGPLCGGLPFARRRSAALPPASAAERRGGRTAPGAVRCGGPAGGEGGLRWSAEPQMESFLMFFVCFYRCFQWDLPE